VPRAGVVHARRPGHGPGRSEAESMDDAEHGASIIGAMVARHDRDTDRGRVLQDNSTQCANRFLRKIPAHFCGWIWPRRWTRGRRDSRARTGHADSDTDHGQRWRERPRQGALGSGAGHGSGVVHAIVPALTSAWACSGESAQNAASLAGARQGTPHQAVACGSRSSLTKGERGPGDEVETRGPT
jgi:hypothetical protein